MKAFPLTKGFVAIVSKEDWSRVRKYKWYTHVSAGTKKKPGQPYARATVDGKKVYLHRFIVGANPAFQVDHKNHQTLDCRRENLEAVTSQVNHQRRRKKKMKIVVDIEPTRC